MRLHTIKVEERLQTRYIDNTTYLWGKETKILIGLYYSLGIPTGTND